MELTIIVIENSINLENKIKQEQAVLSVLFILFKIIKKQEGDLVMKIIEWFLFIWFGLSTLANLVMMLKQNKIGDRVTSAIGSIIVGLSAYVMFTLII